MCAQWGWAAEGTVVSYPWKLAFPGGGRTLHPSGSAAARAASCHPAAAHTAPNAEVLANRHGQS